MDRVAEMMACACGERYSEADLESLVHEAGIMRELGTLE